MSLSSGIADCGCSWQDGAKFPCVRHGGACAKCGKRPASEIWAQSTLDFVHGLYQHWCPRCVLEAQLEAARKRAAEIPSLEAQLAQLERAEEGRDNA